MLRSVLKDAASLMEPLRFVLFIACFNFIPPPEPLALPRKLPAGDESRELGEVASCNTRPKGVPSGGTAETSTLESGFSVASSDPMSEALMTGRGPVRGM
mmetsp:Transcript_38240/g.68582  ORF Transcript_38240/g.68582 Transcript_38240/m.68582 type:complete len:100 (-) Transcript_38240:235-534(-)